ncbi:hypothetical protein AG4045_008311 [Apium graveolens]|uniref:Uncharacterized protein n=1 Tax=Apium graveolens TaxID=4045 RepID=A0A6L5BBC6_APIGR|nr:hypothetical protein AG4045_008311 [Apium graveolens]
MAYYNSAKSMVQFNGFVACTPSGARPKSRDILGASGVLVTGSCKGASGTLAQLRRVPCFVTLKLPATGTSCKVLPPAGTLRAPVRLLSLTGGQIAIVNAEPFQYVAHTS